MYLTYILPASGIKRAKNDSHFYSRTEDEYKDGANTFFICRYV